MNYLQARADMLACNRAMQSSADGTAHGVRFVLATIQQSLETVPAILDSFEREGSASKYAFGSKAVGIDWLSAYGDELHAAAMAAAELRDDAALLDCFLCVPGLGLVKAGFAAQLFASRVGCIDTHNLKLYDVPLSKLRYQKGKALPDTLARKREDYAHLCRSLGGAVNLWARWCDYKAQLTPEHFADGAAVSRLHVECLRG